MQNVSTELIITANSSSTEVTNQTGEPQHVLFAIFFSSLSLTKICPDLLLLNMSSFMWARRLQDLRIHQLWKLQLHLQARLLWRPLWRYKAWCPPSTQFLLLRWAGMQHQAGLCVRQCYATGIWSTAYEEDAAVLDEYNYPNRHGLTLFIMQPLQQQALDVAK